MKYLTLLMLFCAVSNAHAANPQRYDSQFRKAVKLRFGYAVDWRYFKAQAMTESNLNPAVCSPVGACGLMQFMPGTWPAYGGMASRFDAKASIYAGAHYMRRLWRIYNATGRPQGDRLALAFMAYNAGAGSVIKFRKRARAHTGKAFTWGQVCLYAWDEPRHYVERIERWRGRFGGRPLRYQTPPPCKGDSDV